jgi:hypothetical protein
MKYNQIVSVKHTAFILGIILSKSGPKFKLKWLEIYQNIQLTILKSKRYNNSILGQIFKDYYIHYISPHGFVASLKADFQSSHAKKHAQLHKHI